MPFFRLMNINNYQPRFKNDALRAINISSLFGKRASLFPLRRGVTQMTASMAVEAAIALPLYLFFLLNILFAFDMLRLQGSLLSTLHQIGNEAAFHGYTLKKGGDTSKMPVLSILVSNAYIKPCVVDRMGVDYLNNSCLVSGADGLDFSRSRVLNNEEAVELNVTYRVKPFAGILGFAEFPMEANYYGRAWTGYDVERQWGGTEDETVVFVAKTGSVYHMARDCSYLNPSIKVLSSSNIESARNKGGGKYKECGSCSYLPYQAVAFVTEYGDKYHGSLQCQGLKRTVYAVALSQVNGKGCCNKCGSN